MMGRTTKTGWKRRYGSEDKEATNQALRTVGMLDHKGKQIGELSGGEQQRVLIARALTTDPVLLLLDEPTANVDQPMQTGLYELLGELKQRMTVILVSHDLATVSAHVDKIACVSRRLYYHNSKELTPEDLDAAYQCPVEMIAHGIPHRVLKHHDM
jgi:zinc transport system ATP-binding protein